MVFDDLREGRIATKQNIDQYSRFLKPTIPDGQLEYYNPRMPLVSKELSVGNILREDMLGHIPMEYAILDLLDEGQIGLARMLMTSFQGEFKMTMSFDGKFLEHIASNKFEYSQEQHVYEHPLEEEAQAKKKGGFLSGLFGRR